MNAKGAKAKNRIVRKGICYPLLFIIILLACIGLVMVLSSTYTGLLLKDKVAMVQFRQQAMVAVAGIIVMLLISKIDYHIYNKKIFIYGAIGLTIGLLCLVFLFDDVNGAHRWIELGSSGLTLQPSEIAKFTSVLWLAYYLSRNKWWYTSAKTWMAVILPVGIMAGLILIEPNLSTTLCYIAVAAVLLFIAGMQWKAIVGVVGLGAGLVFAMTKFTNYHSSRISAWLDPWADPKISGYQVLQSLYALGDGGLFGVGLGNSKQKITHLPMADTDYIFAMIAEEWGFIGAALVVVLYAAFIYFGIKIAIEAADSFGSYLAAGITSVIGVQVIVNIGVVTNSIPSTGVTLPFISRGSTSLGVFMAAMGILLSVSAYTKRSKKPKEQKKLKQQ